MKTQSATKKDKPATGAWMISPFPVELRRRFHSHCAASGKPMHEVLAQVIEAYLSKEGRQ